MKFYAKLSCGCCDTEMEFDSEANIKEAFRKVGLGSAEIVDDAKQKHEGVDTFYGYWTDENEKRGLSYLFGQVAKIGGK